MDELESTPYESSDEQFVLYRFLGYKADPDEEIMNLETLPLKGKAVTVRLDGLRLWKCDALALANNIGYFRRIFTQNSALIRQESFTTSIIEIGSSNRIGEQAFDMIANDYLVSKEIKMTSKIVGDLEAASTVLDIEDLRASCQHFISLRPGTVLLTDCIKYPQSIQHEVKTGIKVNTDCLLSPKETNETPAFEGTELSPPMLDLDTLSLKKPKPSLAFQNFMRSPENKSEAEDFPCGVCDRSFTCQAHLDMHSRTHTRERPHACPDCHMTFRRSYSLKLHKLTHSGHKEFKCHICGWAFYVRYNLISHVKTHTGEHRKHPCRYCNKVMTSASNLRLHVNSVHMNHRPIECPVCHKTFKMKKHLKSHFFVHSKVRDYKCSLCPKAFSRKDSLKVHMVVHTGERPFKCSQCDRAFVTKNRLTIHEYTHSAYKPYSCSICHQTFTMKDTMLKHVARHFTQQK